MAAAKYTKTPNELPEPLVSPEKDIRPEEVQAGELYRSLNQLGPRCRAN